MTEPLSAAQEYLATHFRGRGWDGEDAAHLAAVFASREQALREEIEALEGELHKTDALMRTHKQRAEERHTLVHDKDCQLHSGGCTCQPRRACTCDEFDVEALYLGAECTACRERRGIK